ncbi:MAG: hypothetical protein ACRDQ2_08740 [Gaiellales bacterium]
MKAKRAKPGNTLVDFWRTVALGGQPTDADLAREGIPARYFAEIRSDVRGVLRLKASGEMGRARARARELADEWVTRLADELQPPSDSMRGETDPRRLAEGLSRW